MIIDFWAPRTAQMMDGSGCDDCDYHDYHDNAVFRGVVRLFRARTRTYIQRKRTRRARTT